MRHLKFWHQTSLFKLTFMQRRFTERRVNANVEWCFVIGQCHGNGALFDVGVGATCASNVVHKVPIFWFHTTLDHALYNAPPLTPVQKQLLMRAITRQWLLEPFGALPVTTSDALCATRLEQVLKSTTQLEAHSFLQLDLPDLTTQNTSDIYGPSRSRVYLWISVNIQGESVFFSIW